MENHLQKIFEHVNACAIHLNELRRAPERDLMGASKRLKLMTQHIELLMAAAKNFDIYCHGGKQRAVRPTEKSKRGDDDTNWMTVAATKRTVPDNNHQHTDIVVSPGGLVISAAIVNSFAEVKRPGILYWLPHVKHFAIIIAGQLFHGNIGYVQDRPIDKNGASAKWKTCKYGKFCDRRAECGYYHDPLIVAGSSDCRDYLAEHSYRHDGYSCGKFGAKQHLDADYLAITAENTSQRMDHLMHDLLGVLIMLSKR